MSISVKSRKAKARKLQNWTAEQISRITGIPWGKDELIQGREMGQGGTDIKLYKEALQRFPFSVENKFQETYSIPAWIKQAKANQIVSTDWLLICKKSREDPIVIMDAKAFFDIYEHLLNLEK